MLLTHKSMRQLGAGKGAGIGNNNQWKHQVINSEDWQAEGNPEIWWFHCISSSLETRLKHSL